MSEQNNADARHIAIKVLQAVIIDGESLASVFDRPALQASSTQDKAFAQMLVYGVLRCYWRLLAIYSLLVKKPLKQKDSDIQIIILLALYQIMDTRVPDYAAVDAAVTQIKKSRKKWAAGMVNAVLRNFIRQQEQLIRDTESDQQALYSHPQWIIDRVKLDWPEDWQQILNANNQQAPMVLRVNTQKISAEDYLSKLDQPDHILQNDTAIALQQSCDVRELPGFNQGWFSVQDSGAQLAAPLLDPQANQRVLDCCAAPGGKTCHLLEMEPSIDLLAVDVSDQRLLKVKENLQRLGLTAQMTCGDAASPEAWWDDKPFDRILLDVPCSASGVIRRHPDIKLLRRDEDIQQLVAVQQKILNNIWPLLAAGGTLLYVTCSIFKEENEMQIETFLQQTSDAQEIAIEAKWGVTRSFGRQILPGQQDMDGFYYSLLVKTN